MAKQSALKTGHRWLVGDSGRSITNTMVEGARSRAAVLSCHACGKTGVLRLRTLLPEGVIDNKFKQLGWRVEPTYCPSCAHPKRAKNEKPHERPEAANDTKTQEEVTTPMSTVAEHAVASPSAMKAQVQAMRLIEEHFSVGDGSYAAGWSDTAVGMRCGLSPEVVAQIRSHGFGDLKEPAELGRLRMELVEAKRTLRSIEDLIKEASATVIRIERRLGEEEKKWRKNVT